MKTEDLFNEIKEIVVTVLEIEDDDIKRDTNFVEDLEVDSMMALEILVAIEKKYKIRIPEERLANIKDLNGSVELAKEFIDKTYS